MEESGSAGERLLGLYRRTGCGRCLPAEPGGRVSRARSSDCGCADEFDEAADARSGEDISSAGHRAQAAPGSELERRRFEQGGGADRFQGGSCLAKVSEDGMSGEISA